MADVFSKGKRSEVMSKIRSTNTKPELIVRRFLFSKGFRFRIHSKFMVGKPDIILKKYKVVIFIHGCFWHGHKSKICKIARIPKSNTAFWENKISYNQNRDVKNSRLIRKSGWRVIKVWECQLRGKKAIRTLENLVNKIVEIK